ncbi:MAG TPA: DUF202 domain-containing protein [Streptosporangiaceae bacterium]|nr:DUF202 domain-containing protein [Streptosporangiaceae bacterium]
MIPEDMEQLDPGLARERTKLAWARTAIAFAAVGGAILKKEPVAGLIVLAMTPIIWGLGRFVGHTAGRPELQPRRLLAVTVTVVAVSVLAMVIAFVGHPPTSLRDVLPLHG